MVSFLIWSFLVSIWLDFSIRVSKDIFLSRNSEKISKHIGAKISSDSKKTYPFLGGLRFLWGSWCSQVLWGWDSASLKGDEVTTQSSDFTCREREIDLLCRHIQVVVEPTHLKNMSQIGFFCNPPPSKNMQKLPPFLVTVKQQDYILKRNGEFPGNLHPKLRNRTRRFSCCSGLQSNGCNPKWTDMKRLFKCLQVGQLRNKLLIFMLALLILQVGLWTNTFFLFDVKPCFHWVPLTSWCWRQREEPVVGPGGCRIGKISVLAAGTAVGKKGKRADLWLGVIRFRKKSFRCRIRSGRVFHNKLGRISVKMNIFRGEDKKRWMKPPPFWKIPIFVKISLWVLRVNTNV